MMSHFYLGTQVTSTCVFVEAQIDSIFLDCFLQVMNFTEQQVASFIAFVGILSVLAQVSFADSLSSYKSIRLSVMIVIADIMTLYW